MTDNTDVLRTMPPISRQIWDMKYRLKAADGTIIDATVEDTWERVAIALAAAEKPEDQVRWASRFYAAMEDFRYIPAGRILAGAGTSRDVTCFNCYVMGTIPDSLDGIFRHLREAALTMQQGGGIGYDFSSLRPKGALVRGVDAESSGPVSFMDVWDAMCKTLMSAGYRRGAMMATLRCDHPDVLEFVNAKHEKGRLTQFNMSVLVTDAFMAAVKSNVDWDLQFNGKTYKVIKARELWDAIMRSTYDHAEPGVIFIDRINKRNNLYYIEKIYATNPCFAADTLIVTGKGAFPIEDLVGAGPVNIWDGQGWCLVDNFRETGRNQQMLKITLQDGSSLRVTPYHMMIREDGSRIEARMLTVGTSLKLHDVTYDGDIGENGAYLKGFLLGDGHLKNSSRPTLLLYEPKFACRDRLLRSAAEIEPGEIRTNGTAQLGFVEQETDKYFRLSMTGLTPRSQELFGWCGEYKNGLPPFVHRWDRKSKTEFLAGMFDSDGCGCVSNSGFGYQLSSIHRKLLIDVQTILKSIGVRSKLGLMHPAKRKEMPGGVYNTQPAWRLSIAQAGAIELAKQVGFERVQSFANREIINLTRPKMGQVVAVESDGVDNAVYCCTVPYRHEVALATGITTANCGEQPLPPYGACLLGSINLASLVVNPFTPDAFIDTAELDWIVPSAVRMMDNVVDVSKFPLEAQKDEAKAKRRLGLGVTGLANALAMCGIRYGTKEAADLTRVWMAQIEERAYLASADLAAEKGPFLLFDRDKFLAGEHVKSALSARTRDAIGQFGMRNSHLTSVAPTGTISLFARNVSSGIEPPFSHSFTRKVLQPDGSRSEERVEDYAYSKFFEMHGEVSLPEHFVTAQDLAPQDHLVMMAAAQEHVDSAISKTTNLPREISFEDFQDVYWTAYQLGCKSCTTYRPNDITGSILSVEESPAPEGEKTLRAIKNAEANFPYACPDLDQIEGPPGAAVEPEDDEPEDTLPTRAESLSGRTYKARWTDGVGNHAYYVTINDGGSEGKPFEIFVNSRDVEHQAWTTALTRMLSAVFRRGGDLRFVPEELKAVVDPKGGAWIEGRYIPSLPALIGEVIERHMQETAANHQLQSSIEYMNELADDAFRKMEMEKTEAVNQSLKRWEQCPKCGAFAITRSEGCKSCVECGWTKCG